MRTSINKGECVISQKIEDICATFLKTPMKSRNSHKKLKMKKVGDWGKKERKKRLIKC